MQNIVYFSFLFVNFYDYKLKFKVRLSNLC